MTWIKTLLVLILVSSIFGFGATEESESEKPRETYVSPAEETIRLLIRSGRKFEQGVEALKNDLRSLTSFLPQPNNTIVKKPTIGDVLNPFKFRIKAIYPGTYWCGDGDASSKNSNFGLFKRTDACCKAHDSCSQWIPAQGTRGGLVNNGIFTRSHCSCDKEFYDCLKGARSFVATKIGFTYFNVLRPQCFRESYPTAGCRKYAGRRLIDDKCSEYEYKHNESKRLEWFDNPDFIVI
ncbi:phospholipase A2-like [Ptiloglossa arizonensis]|uniref:phospholipase A2-like n=1 Tax=Ptiloglossa arizonensis TaxID=3350558 RepID=UPI003F9F0190